MKKITLTILALSLFPLTSLASYEIELPVKRNQVKLLNEVGKTLSADDYVHQYLKNRKNQPKKLIEKKITEIINSPNNRISLNQKTALLDVSEQLKLNVGLLNNQNIKLYEQYLNKKKKTKEGEIVNFYKQEFLKPNKTNNKKGGKIEKIIVDTKQTDFHNNYFVQYGKLKKEELEKKYKIKIENSSYLSKEKYNEIVKNNDEKYSIEDLKKLKITYQINKKELTKLLNKKIEEKKIEEYCVNEEIASEFFFINSKDVKLTYEMFFSPFRKGKFMITRNVNSQLPYKITSPSFAEIKERAIENERRIKKEAIDKNAFVINILDGNLFKDMIEKANLLGREKIKGNLFNTSINDLALYSIALNEKDKKDFFEVSLKLMEYNALSCVF